MLQCVLLSVVPLLKQTVSALYYFLVRSSGRAQWEQSENGKTPSEIRNVISEISQGK